MAARLLALAALATSAVLLAGCGTVGRVEGGSQARGKELFNQKCAQCHALKDAGARGVIGPDLDAAFATVRSDDPGQGFDESTIRDVIRGQIAYPVEDPATDAPGMPANLVTGEDADAVAVYVAAVAGLPVKDTGQQAAGGGKETTDPKEIFNSQGCQGCHVLSKAGATGTVGPNLDEAKPGLEEAVAQIRNGGGGMPAYKDDLTEQQIQAVAKYIAGGK